MIVYLAMVFVVFEILSMIFNQYFVSMNFFGITLPVNISVIFFCVGFFILDLVTEIYNKKIADKLIYGKILCQVLFVLFGEIGIIGATLQGSQLSQIIIATPKMILYSIIASFFGYKLTTSLMQWLKLRYNGQFLMLRYLCSTLPGELVFSLIFSILSFSTGKSLSQFIMIFLTLSGIKIALSVAFSILVVPVTNFIKLFCYRHNEIVEYIAFT